MPFSFRRRAQSVFSASSPSSLFNVLTVLIAAVFLLGAISMQASAEDAATPAPVSPTYKAMVKKLLQFSGGETIGQQMAYGAAQEALVSLSSAGMEIDEQIQQIVLEEAMADFGKRFSDLDYLADLYAPIYAEQLSEKELTEVVAFYESPIGQKSLQALPVVGQAALQALQQATVERLPAFEENVMAKLRAAGIVEGE